MATLGEQGFDICLQAGATTGIMAGETEDNGARAVDIHGARAYHQTLLAGLLRTVGFSPWVEGFSNPNECMRIAESPVLEPFKKLFQWCLIAFSGYARVDPNY
ncbi:hypothetical protein cym2001_54830 [Pseudomonas sp. CYM-20-01]|nr:hypothetical protein cym2001_54830 [Pseudomonas sp. CYM-20-01]